MNACRGFFGRVFGHKFYRGGPFDDVLFPTDFCTRCGFLPDGSMTHWTTDTPDLPQKETP